MDLLITLEGAMMVSTHCRSAAEGWQGQMFGQCLAAITKTSAPVSKSPKNHFSFKNKVISAYLLLVVPVGMFRGTESSISPWGVN
jgi:hypothetical protein